MTFSFEYHLKALVYLHLQEYESGRELLQVLEEDEFAKEYIVPPDGVGRSTFFEAMNTRALPQLIKMYELLQEQAKDILPVCSAELGKLVAVDGSLIDAVPTMEFADYRTGVKKAKAHLNLWNLWGRPSYIHIRLKIGLLVQFMANVNMRRASPSRTEGRPPVVPSADYG